jgi:hypothetical protein
MSEKVVQTSVKRLLDLFNVAVYDTSQPFRAKITPGVPDLICFCEKRGLFFVEVKDEKGKQTPAQSAFECLANKAGIPYILGGVDEVKSFLSQR